MEYALESIKPAELPAPAQAAIQIMRACADPNVSNQQLGELVSTDPVMTAEILRIVNSPFFGMGGEIANATRAINILGHKALRNMVMCISVRDALNPDDVPGFDTSGFWEDTLRRATSAKLLGRLTGIDEDDCFTAGLLQDFGMLVMFHIMRDRQAEWSRFIRLDPEMRRQMEEEVFGVTHDRISLMLAREWSLPDHFAQAIGGHHDCESLEAGGAAIRLCSVLHCADWLAAMFSASGKAKILQKVHAKLDDYLDIPESQCLEILNQVPPQVEEAATALGLRLDEQADFEQILRDTNVRLAEENTSYQELTWQLEKALKERDDLADALGSELELAAEIQRSLLPEEKEATFPVYGVNVSARELSGDFFDYFLLEDGSIHFNLGDVSGKGVTASLLMAKTSSLFRCLGKKEPDPGKLMKQINEEICETSIRGMFVAMVAGRYTPATGHVQIVNAGNPPVLFVQDNKQLKKIDACAPPLGIEAGAEFPVFEFNLGKGHLLMYSDGVTEGYIDEGVELGMQGLVQILREHDDKSPRSLLESILAKFMDAKVRQRDDITIMVLEHSEQEITYLCKYEFTAKPEELQLMRQKVRKILEQQNCEKGCIDRLILAVNEAAMNIIQHAYQDDVNGRIMIEVLLREDDLIFRLTDFACPIDSSCVKSRDLADIRPGGLGVHFMHEIMDDVKFQEHCGEAGNILIMRKRLDETCVKSKGEN